MQILRYLNYEDGRSVADWVMAGDFYCVPGRTLIVRDELATKYIVFDDYSEYERYVVSAGKCSSKCYVGVIWVIGAHTSDQWPPQQSTWS